MEDMFETGLAQRKATLGDAMSNARWTRLTTSPNRFRKP